MKWARHTEKFKKAANVLGEFKETWKVRVQRERQKLD
jgi:hypothetical protein